MVASRARGESKKRRKEMLKGFRYLIQDKPKGTILKKEFVDSMEWVWRKGLAVEIGVDVRSGGIWQLEEAVLAIESIVKKDVPDNVGSFVISMYPRYTLICKRSSLNNLCYRSPL